MLPKRLTDALLVCGQISVQDVDRFAEAGVRLIINNRPDGEEPGQPTSDEHPRPGRGEGRRLAPYSRERRPLRRRGDRRLRRGPR